MMIKLTKLLLLITSVNFVALCAVTLTLPERVITNINAMTGEVLYGPRWLVPLVGVISFAMLGLMAVYRKWAARNERAARNQKAEDTMLFAMSLFFLVITWLPVWLAKAGDPERYLPLIIGLPFGVLMMVLSNYMGTLRQNKTLGLRLPWTLRDEEVWNRTHRVAAWWGCVGGLVMIAGAVLSYLINSLTLFFVGLTLAILLIVVYPTVYAWRLYQKRHPKQ